MIDVARTTICGLRAPTLVEIGVELLERERRVRCKGTADRDGRGRAAARARGRGGRGRTRDGGGGGGQGLLAPKHLLERESLAAGLLALVLRDDGFCGLGRALEGLQKGSAHFGNLGGFALGGGSW